MLKKLVWGIILSLTAGVYLSAETGLKYDIDVRLDHGKRMLYGKEKIVWTNQTQDTVEDMYLHLYWNAFKNEKSAVGREYRRSGSSLFRKRAAKSQLGWIEVTSISPVKGEPEFVMVDTPHPEGDETVMRVVFEEPVKPGETVTLNMEFKSRIPRTIMRTGYYQNGYFFGQWYPKPGVYEEGKGWNCHHFHKNSEFYAPFADFRVKMTVPQEFVIGSSGKQINIAKDHSKKTVTYTFEQKRVHDFAWTVDPDYIKVERDFIADKEVTPEEYKKVAAQLQLPVEEVKLSDVKMILLINPEHKDQIEKHFDALKGSIKYYGLWYGRYPYETMTLIDPPFRTACGGMEYPTLITAGTGYYKSESRMVPEYVTIHEFGHNFWYGLCANNEFEEAWLDEGINSYSDGKVAKALFGNPRIPLPVMGIPMERYVRNFRVDKTFLNRASAIFVAKVDPVFTNSWEFMNGSSYSSNVYGRAATVIESLERILGEDMMLRVLRTFHMNFRYKHPETADFIETVNKVTGRDFNWFFEEFMNSTRAMDYGIGSVTVKKVREPAGYFRKNGKQVNFPKGEKESKEDLYESTVLVRNFGEARVGGDVKIKVRMVFDDGKEKIELWDGASSWKRYTYQGKSQIVHAELDPDRVFLMDSNFTNNSKRVEADGRASKRWGSKLLFWIQNLLMFTSSAV